MSAARKRRIVRLPPQVSIIKALERTQFGPPKTLAALVAQVFNIDLEVTTRMGNRSLRAFISSKMEELALERMTIRAALAEMHIEAFVFEKDAGARPYNIQQTYLVELEAANLYIGVFWKGYGKYTIEGYEHAQTLGMD
jgi:hypothetical protein